MRKLFLYVILFPLVVAIIGGIWWHPFLWLLILVIPLSLLGLYDLLQPHHTLLRNYPVLAHLRYLFEDIHTQIRQYFIEGDLDGHPFAREQRELVYQRAKGLPSLHPFGTIEDVYKPGYEWINHSVVARWPMKEEMRITVGSSQCKAPYSASRFNISAMSFGALSPTAIKALNTGARKGGFAHCTGEGGISRYHREPGGDLIWQIGTGYFGCRKEDGHFDPDLFQKQASTDQVKMIEVKLSQGAKPGGGGILPAAKVTRDIADARLVPMGKDVDSPPYHSAFSTPVEMLQWMRQLRELSGGKPVGFKLCLGSRRQFMAILKAMKETGILVDFITVDGGEGGTGAAPQELSDFLGTPLRDALIYVHNALVGLDLRNEIRIICSGKIVSGADMAAKIAMGADMCNCARGMMLALGCIQARRCHTNTCPTGIATQDPGRYKGLVVADKGERIYRFHKSTIEHFQWVLAAAGMEKAEELSPSELNRRLSFNEVKNYSELFDYLTPGAILEGRAPEEYLNAWNQAQGGAF
jgi:glutamate synthase domain-containing protein 2